MTIASCPPSTPVTRGVVVFVAADFKTAFPEFATVADPALVLNFGLAELQLANTCKGRVINAVEREKLLNLLVAHITQLRNGANGVAPGGMVGRISSAQEGSVRADADMGTVVYGQAYYLQTQWGAMFWQATAKYRTAVYIPAPIVCADVAGLPGFFPGNGFFPGDGSNGGSGCGC